MKTRVFLSFLSVLFLLFFWQYLGEKAVYKDDSNTFSKLQCVSYAPFGKDESPFLFDKGLVLKEENIRKDLELLSQYTNCVRTYSTIGLENVYRVASDLNLEVLMGIWISKDEKASQEEVDEAIRLSQIYKNIKAVIVGNEVLLRKDASQARLINHIKDVKAKVPSNIKVTYADVWEFWLQNKVLKDYTDFVTIHILPYWEDDPQNIEDSINHVKNVRIDVEKELDTQNILIGETGWPSEGRAREDAVASKINQAKYVRDFVKLANDNSWQYNIIEAFDQPWKRVSEGAVGGYWGLFDAQRLDKKVFAGDVSNFPNYKTLALISFVLFFAFVLKLKKVLISRKQIVGFLAFNTVFALLTTLQIEQYLVISRNYLEGVWAVLILLLVLYFYNFTLEQILSTKKELVSKIAVYFAIFTFLILSSKLAYNGRYENFEIYGFVLIVISLLYLLFGKTKELEFNLFDKLIAIYLLITLVVLFISETYLNIFSNIWIVLGLYFVAILNVGAGSLKDIKKYILPIVLALVFTLLYKYTFIMNSSFEITCIENAGMLCSLRDFTWKSIYFGHLGFLALIFAIVANFLKSKVVLYLAIVLCLASILLTNVVLGLFALILLIYKISEENGRSRA